MIERIYLPMRISSLTMPAVAVLLAASPSPARTRRRSYRRKTTLKVGDPAPEFGLVELDEEGNEKGRTSLSSFRGRSPVVLVFSSYT